MEILEEFNREIESSGIPHVSVGFQQIGSGQPPVLIQPDLSFHAASTMKVPVMCEVYRQASEGVLGLDESIEITNEFESILDGSRFPNDREDDSEQTLYDRVGEPVPVRELVEAMITNSSNLATNVLLKRVGAASVCSFMSQIGADGLKVIRYLDDRPAFRAGLNNQATARGYLTLLVALAEGKAVNKAASDEMLEVLSRTRHRRAIPAGLPSDFFVANKPGWVEGYCHDGAVVRSPNGDTYALCVFTNGAQTQADAHKLIATLARLGIQP